MILKYRIIFTDNYGQGTFECDTFEEYAEKLKNLANDPEVEDFFAEWLDDETGWQA